MFSFRRIALVLAFAIPAAHLALAQDSTSSSSTSAPAQQPAPDQTQQSNAPDNTQAVHSVQDRMRMRRDARRTAAMRDVYSHLFEVNAGMGYMRFVPGNNLQRTTMYAWNVGLTRFYNQRLGVTLDGRGNYGTSFVGLNQFNVTRPAISTYTGMIGPTYRFYLQPKYSVAVRAMGGYAHGNFSGDANGFPLGLWGDGGTFAGSAAVIGEYNVSPGFGLRLAPEYFLTGFGSTVQASRGFTAGFVFRFGKQ